MAVAKVAAGLPPRFTEEVPSDAPLQGSLRRAHSTFLSTGQADAGVRPMVVASWRRSLAAGVQADRGAAPTTLGRSDLLAYRSEHRLSRVFPLLYDVVGRIAQDCGCVMALGDEYGQLLWVCGQPQVLRRAESINFVEGTSWQEATAGTNAPGTALRLDAPVVIRAAEHFNQQVKGWSCAAAPIHDPATQAILGILDITGGDDVASPQTLGMVRAAARMAESELARIALVESADSSAMRSTSAPGAALIEVQALGRPDCLVRINGRTLRMSPRHGEILVLLMDAPAGFTGEQLEVELYAADMHSSTMRAEMVRLRQLLGPDVLRSRPYRLVAPVSGDWQQVLHELDAGRVQQAVAAYRGPLLPHSDAPGVALARDAVHRRLRSALLTCGRPELIGSWTRSRWGADDLPMWRRQAELLPGTSPLRALARGEVARLDRLLS